MVDMLEVESAIENFVFSAKPSNSDSSAPATVGDINNLITQTVELARALIDVIDAIDQHPCHRHPWRWLLQIRELPFALIPAYIP